LATFPPSTQTKCDGINKRSPCDTGKVPDFISIFVPGGVFKLHIKETIESKSKKRHEKE